MTKVIKFEDYKKGQKKEDIKTWFCNKKYEAIRFINNNRDLIIFVGPAVLGAVATGFKVIGKRVNLRKQQNLKDLYCYDRSLGHYWRLRREISNSEWLEIDKRKQNGERLSDILDELKLLK